MVQIPTADGATVNLLHLAGNCGPVVLFLHANGFHIRCYTPLAEHFAKQSYQCWGIEFRGQGRLPAPAGNLVDLYLSDVFSVIDALSLRGCLAFTHSGGAQAAIRAEAQQPGTFAAIYAFEPVLWPVSPPSAKETSEDPGRGYWVLAAAARRRKHHFTSKQDAAKRFRSRPPFSAFHQGCFQQYIHNGLQDLSDGACRLAISTESEARWYIDAGQLAMESGHDDPPQVQCPTTIAVGSSISGAVTYLAAEGTKQVHRFPKGRLESFEGLTHLGPLEDPVRVASKALQMFQASKDSKTWADLPPSEIIPVTNAKL